MASKNKQNKETPGQHSLTPSSRRSTPTRPNFHTSGTSFSDWIGGTCYADTLQVWFPAHWAPVVLQQLQQKEDNYRAENPSWMDQEEAPADILKQWREARANRRVQFKVGKYRDGSGRATFVSTLLSGSVPMNIRCVLYLRSTSSLPQGICRVSFPPTSGSRRCSGMVI